MVGVLVTKIATTNEVDQQPKEIFDKNINLNKHRLSTVQEVSTMNLCPHGIQKSSNNLEDKITCLLCHSPDGISNSEKKSEKIKIIDLEDEASDSNPQLTETKQNIQFQEKTQQEPQPKSKYVVGEHVSDREREVPKVTRKIQRHSAPVGPSGYISSGSGFAPIGHLSRSATAETSLHKSYSCEVYQATDLVGQQLRRTQSLKTLSQLPADTLSKSDRRLLEAFKCPRITSRRNALNNPFKMTMPQETRERIQKENHERKTSVRRRALQYFRSLVDEEPEVDLS